MDYWELYDIIEEILTEYWETPVVWKMEAGKVIARNPTTDIKQDNTPMVRRVALQQYGLPTLNQIDVGLMTFSK